MRSWVQTHRRTPATLGQSLTLYHYCCCACPHQRPPQSDPKPAFAGLSQQAYGHMLESHIGFGCSDNQQIDHFCNLMNVQDSVAHFGSILQLSLSAGGQNLAAGLMVAAEGVNANKLPTQFAHICSFSARYLPEVKQRNKVVLALRSHCRYCELDDFATSGCISCCISYQECTAEPKCTAAVSDHMQDPTRIPRLAAVFWSSMHSFTAAGTTLASVHSQNSIPDVTTACRILARLAAFTVGVHILPPWTLLTEAATPCRIQATMLWK
jgi:hypothetical protein